MSIEPTLAGLTAAFDLQPLMPESGKHPILEPSPRVDPTPVAGDAGDRSIDPLNRLLRHELAAVEAYQRVLSALEPPHGVFLTTLLEEHRLRVAILRGRVLTLHGQPAGGPGAWGVLVRLAEGTASLMGIQVMLAVLEEMEAHGVTDYQRELGNLDAQSRELVEVSLLPAQEFAVTELVGLRASKAETLPPGP